MKGFFCKTGSKYCHFCYDEANKILKENNIDNVCIDFVTDAKISSIRVNTAAYALDDFIQENSNDLTKEQEEDLEKIINLLQKTHHDIMKTIVNLVGKYTTPSCITLNKTKKKKS